MTDEERQLRDALHDRAAAVPVGRADEKGLGQRLVAARRRRRATLAGAAAALAVVFGAATLVAMADDPASNVVAGPGPSSSTTTIAEPSTTVGTAPVDSTQPVGPTTTGVPAGPTVTTGPVPTTVPRTTSTTTPLASVPDDAVWPPPGSTTSFPTAERAADDFARRFLGMGTPQLSPGRVTARGDEALFDLRPLPAATLTTLVLARRIDRRGWVIVSCSADTIQVDQPTGGARVASPLTVRGRTQAFEGHVDVDVRGDGSTTPIGRAFGTGASDTMAPFETTVAFTRPSTPRGTVMVSEPRADDATQGPGAATVIRVSF